MLQSGIIELDVHSMYEQGAGETYIDSQLKRAKRCLPDKVIHGIEVAPRFGIWSAKTYKGIIKKVVRVELPLNPGRNESDIEGVLLI